jgi:hypothetical protein
MELGLKGRGPVMSDGDLLCCRGLGMRINVLGSAFICASDLVSLVHGNLRNWHMGR